MGVNAIAATRDVVVKYFVNMKSLSGQLKG